MASTVTPFVVITVSRDGHVHAYGPYSNNEAVRMKKQFDKRYSADVHSFVRKLQLGNEVNANPKAPKG